MVDYSTWFGLVQSVATSKGELSQEQRGNLTSELAQYWNENKSELKAMTKSEARQLAEKIVSV